MIALLREADRQWMTDAACREHDPDLWFPTAGLPSPQVKAVCDQCPVRRQCDEYADTHDERYGVWGGRQRGLKKRGRRG